MTSGTKRARRHTHIQLHESSACTYTHIHICINIHLCLCARLCVFWYIFPMRCERQVAHLKLYKSSCGDACFPSARLPTFLPRLTALNDFLWLIARLWCIIEIESNDIWSPQRIEICHLCYYCFCAATVAFVIVVYCCCALSDLHEQSLNNATALLKCAGTHSAVACTRLPLAAASAPYRASPQF